jgi:hypothetical protein
MLSVTYAVIVLNAAMLSVVMLSQIMLSVIMLSVIMLSVIMLSVIMLSVVASIMFLMLAWSGFFLFQGVLTDGKGSVRLTSLH